MWACRTAKGAGKTAERHAGITARSAEEFPDEAHKLAAKEAAEVVVKVQEYSAAATEASAVADKLIEEAAG